MTKPLVSVVMITYKHEKYIKQAIEGVLMQKTDFDVELIIANDASPDNTDAVVKSILDDYQGEIRIRYYKHKQNKGISKNFAWALQQAMGKYIAICEGDDYWIDSDKLKKQVGFLEEHSNVGLVGTHRTNYIQKKNKYYTPQLFNEPFKIYKFEDIIIESHIATLTVLVKKELIDKYLYAFNKYNLSGLDYSIWLYISYHSDVAILRDNTAVYRILENSVSHSSDSEKIWKLRKKYFNDLKKILVHFDNVNDEIKNKAMYFRAKSHYLLVTKSKDKDSIIEIKKNLLDNRDYLRYSLLSIISLFPRLYFIGKLFEKITSNVKT